MKALRSDPAFRAAAWLRGLGYQVDGWSESQIFETWLALQPEDVFQQALAAREARQDVERANEEAGGDWMIEMREQILREVADAEAATKAAMGVEKGKEVSSK